MVFKLRSGHEFTIVEFQREITQTIYTQKVRLVYSACRLMILYISVKFRENILNGQVIERTRLQIDRKPRQKQYVSTPVRGRHNNYKTIDKSYGSCIV